MMRDFYNSPGIRLLRLGLFLFLILWLRGDLIQGDFPRLSLFFLNIFLIHEIFFRFKIGKTRPPLPISANQGELYKSFTPEALLVCLKSQKPADFLKHLLRHQQAKFILEKSGFDPKKLTCVPLPLTNLVTSAFEVAKRLHGGYVTTMDLLCAYLLLTEPQTKLLFQAKLKPDDLLRITSWARSRYETEEYPEKFRLNYSEAGIGEAIVSGWTPETKQYTRSLTQNALRKRPLLIGRENDFKRILEILAKKEQNNVLLVGEAGLGKETLVEAFAYDSNQGKLGRKLSWKQVWEVMLGQLIAGATDRSLLEERLQAIVSEVTHAGNVVLFIPELQNLLGSTSYALDLSGALLPYLKDGGLPIIASMTPGAYKKYLESSPLREVFTVIALSEPDLETALHMLFEKTGEIEDKTGLSLSYLAVNASVQYAKRYLPDENLPGSAVRLLEDAAYALSNSGSQAKSLTEDTVITQVEIQTHAAIAAPKPIEQDLLLHLEERLHERIIGQDAAVSVLSQSLRRLRSGVMQPNKPVSYLFLGPTGVGKTETAKTLAKLYFGGEENILRFDMSEYAGLNAMTRLLGSPPGTNDERGELTEKVHDHPVSLILLDEFEKADRQILHLFLQVFDDGRLTDNKGRTVSFANALIIATSNAGSEYIREESKKGKTIDKQFTKELLDHLQSNNIYTPELLNRFSDIVVFTSLNPEELTQITHLLLADLIKQMDKIDVKLSFTEEVIAKIITEGADLQFGARPLRRYIRDTFEDMIAKMKLQQVIVRGSTVLFSLDKENQLQVSVS